MQLDGGKLIPSPVHLSVNENTVEKNCLGSTEGGRKEENQFTIEQTRTSCLSIRLESSAFVFS